jgi:signal peptidase I
VKVAAGGAALLLGAGWWAAKQLRVAVVSGPSMSPTLRDRDRVLVRRVRPAALRRGDVALVAMPGQPGRGWIIKRVVALPGDPVPAGLSPAGSSVAGSSLAGSVPAGVLVLLGDNPESSVDSRDFGYVPADRLFGVTVRRL